MNGQLDKDGFVFANRGVPVRQPLVEGQATKGRRSSDYDLARKGRRCVSRSRLAEKEELCVGHLMRRGLNEVRRGLQSLVGGACYWAVGVPKGPKIVNL